LFVVLVLAGCGRNDIQVYKLSKEQTPQQPSGMPPGHPDVGGGAPRLQWKLPPGWQEVAPGEMRVASFKVTGENGKQADVSVVPLPGLAGRDIDNVNRWRGQVGLSPIAKEKLEKQAQAVEISGQAGQLYEMSGQNPGSSEKMRILAAVSRRDGMAWFFKMTGDDDLVAKQKPAFVDFLKTLAFPAAPVSTDLPPSHPPIGGLSLTPPPASQPVNSEGKPEWQVPAGWQEVPGGQFLVAKFNIAGNDNAQANVNVSMSGGTGGGLLANVNRWRGQLGLSQLSDAELAKESKTVELPGGKATLVEMAGVDGRTGQNSRLVGAIVPQGNQTWFYKLMGNAGVVEQQKDAFTRFLQTVKYAP
jgi:hypothetical protein